MSTGNTDNVDVLGAADGLSIASKEWMRRNEALYVFGIGKDILRSWACSGVVEAHKLDPAKNGTVIFSVRDIRRAIRNTPLYGAVKREVQRDLRNGASDTTIQAIN